MIGGPISTAQIWEVRTGAVISQTAPAVEGAVYRETCFLMQPVVFDRVAVPMAREVRRVIDRDR